MATLRDVVAHICLNYPFPNELSKARLTKLVYLADWKMCLEDGRQITPTRWYFHHFGPYVSDVEDLARNDPAFSVEQTSNFYGSMKEIIRMTEAIHPNLSNEERKVIDFCITNTQSLSWDAFIKLVYSTHPILSESRFAFLDLPALANQYKNVQTT